MSRNPFVVTDAMREKVRYLSGVGVRQDDIAKIIDCAPKTLWKRFRDELDRGVAEANATMLGYLFAAAKAGNIAAIIFWLKTRAQLRETKLPEDADAGDDEKFSSGVVVLLPDDGRDPELTKVLMRAQQEAQDKYYARKRREQERSRKSQRG